MKASHFTHARSRLLSPLMPSNHYSLWLITALFFIFLSASVGIVWIAYNLDFVPQYGDTTEYLELAERLCVDQYRGIFYPYFIHLCHELTNFINLKLHHIIYSIQITLALFSSSCFSYSLLPTNSRSHYGVSRKWLPAIIGFLASLDPLTAHFSLTILTDSIATSFTLLFLSCLILTLKNIRSIIYMITTVPFIIILSLIRVDKFYSSLLIFLLFIIFLLFKSQTIKYYKTTAVLALFIIFFTVFSVIFIKNKTQIYNAHRPPLDSSSFAFNRIVWPRMSKAYDYFPENIKKNITKEEAKNFDKHNNNVYPFLVKTLEKSNGKQMIATMTWITFKEFPAAIFSKIMFDFTKYSIPNLTYPLELLGLLPISIATDWTFSRMEMFQPRCTKIFIILGTLSFLLMLLDCFIRFFFKKLPVWNTVINPQTLFVMGSAIFTNAILFTLEAGMDAHIRYALPTYTIIIVFVTTSFFSGLVNYKNHGFLATLSTEKS